MFESVDGTLIKAHVKKKVDTDMFIILSIKFNRVFNLKLSYKSYIYTDLSIYLYLYTYIDLDILLSVIWAKAFLNERPKEISQDTFPN